MERTVIEITYIIRILVCRVFIMKNINFTEKFNVNEVNGLYLKVFKPGTILGYKKDPVKCKSILINEYKDKKTGQKKVKKTEVEYQIKERNVSNCFSQTFIRPENVEWWSSTKNSPFVTEQMLADRGKYKDLINSLNYKWNKLSKIEKLCYYLSLFDEGLGIEVTPYYEDEYLRKRNK